MFKKQVLMASAVALSLTGEMAIADSTTKATHFTVAPAPVLMSQGDEQEADLVDRLDLSTAQRQQIQGIRANYRSQMGAKRAAIQQAKNTMRTLMRNSTTSRNQLEAQHRTITNLRQDLADLHFRQMLDIREVLTPAQRAELAQHMAQKRQGDRFQRWRSWFGWRQ
ncbi:Spy/CpxP family protein refolding chaperone [Synechococcus sp. BDU 130192]|uniref:Spy/CpxP family protein refolding chaperone n=1 Tax=Synechococcus sp. BDU 130192 TaxID=2042059 RepID=UPI000C071D64|nr:Spy/CpxP family protein refolding chaperone [Synechococcus sp. BDU 130192]